MILQHRENPAAFRDAVRAWLSSVSPKNWEERLSHGSDAEHVELQKWWMAERAKVGLATPHWPTEFGGADLSLKHQIIVAEEVARANAPPLQAYVVSLHHLPATLIAWGTDDQKAKYLPGVSKGDIWCQGFSEPNAGSDLAALRCRAVRKGDRYVVNGQKIWSSNSMHAKYCILLARTDPDAPKHKGISFFLLDMKSAGVEVRPIRQSNGRAEFGEIFLNDVEIPAENLVGPENDGWRVSHSTLAAERGVLVFEAIERLRYLYENICLHAIETNAGWLRDDQMRREFIVLLGEMQSIRRLIRQLLRENEVKGAPSTMTPAFVKLMSSEHRKKFASWWVRIAGPDSQSLLPSLATIGGDPMMLYVSSFGSAIAAGTNEIMRNIVAERGLGLPR